ncbi:hypothetical protein GCM10023153_28200 [Ornithinibacter aureus]|uniref:GPI inositol-deacylase PGAP1-like alpha/beta domain-containing protein n=1 Tax=Ornithinibacter aureus TaxID=622664 RepID=A0ABP8K4S1_9MICO|nr:hypothetical protein [Ornithinibacter aureus]KAF0833952.1 PGAP1-like protein [Ornithinibacter aureus]
MRVDVRSETLTAAAQRVAAIAEELREDAGRLAAVLAGIGLPRVRSPGEVVLIARWLSVEGRALALVGPGGLWGHSLEFDGLATALRSAARTYVEVERGVAGILAAVAAGADVAGRAGWLVDGPVNGSSPIVRAVPSTLTGPLVGHGGVHGRVPGVADLVAAGEGLDGGRVRVVETTRGDGGSAWVVIIPGTQEWSPRPGSNPFDLSTDVRALTGDATIAAAGVSAALARARAESGRSSPQDPVMLVGHSQGGILAAALVSDPAFRAGNRVTHVVTSGAPVGLFPVPASTRVLSIEHADDPVSRLDLTPNPSGQSWTTLVAPRGGQGAPMDLGRHRLSSYVQTVRAAEGAPRGAVPGLDAWQVSAGEVLGREVRSVRDHVIERGGATT